MHPYGPGGPDLLEMYHAHELVERQRRDAAQVRAAESRRRLMQATNALAIMRRAAAHDPRA